MRNSRPNTKVNKFYDENEFELDIEMAREWMEGDNNFKVVLYRVDKANTQTYDIYNEADIDGITYLPPIELNVYPMLGEAENRAYNSNSSVRYKQDGDFTFLIYEQEISEKGVNISFGDFIGYDVEPTVRRYFEVIDDDAINFANNKTIMGYKRAAKQIRCKAVSPDVFNGI